MLWFLLCLTGANHFASLSFHTLNDKTREVESALPGCCKRYYEHGEEAPPTLSAGRDHRWPLVAVDFN